MKKINKKQIKSIEKITDFFVPFESNRSIFFQTKKINKKKSK